MELPKRKPNRLKDYDYSQNGAYFITICTHEREKLLWKENLVGASIARPLNQNNFSKNGLIVKEAIENISKIYKNTNIEKYVIMPNHVHLLILINNKNGRAMHAPTISIIINQLKGYITKQIGTNIWQKLFHDHIIRNQNDYDKIWEYIDTNPQKWEIDCFYEKTTIN